MFDTPPRYQSYLLTVWEERNRDPNLPAVWRLSLEDPHTGQRRGFADLEALTAALKEMMGNERARGQHPAACRGLRVGTPGRCVRGGDMQKKLQRSTE